MSRLRFRLKQFGDVVIDPSQNVISPSSLNNGTPGQAFSQQLSTLHSIGSVTYTIAAGALPTGVTMSSSGLISGTPTASGTFTFIVRSTDSDSPAEQVTRSYTFTVPALTLSLSPSSLPSASFGVAYTQSMSASGGLTPYTYSVS